MGLLFQPRRPASGAPRVVPHPVADAPIDRPRVLVAALEAVMLGDASRFAELFSDDVEFTSPHLSVASLGSLQRELGVPEDSLSDLRVVVVALDAVGDKLIIEWRLEAMFTRPVLLDDRVLIEPTGATGSPHRGLVRRVQRSEDPCIPALLRRQRALGGRPGLSPSALLRVDLTLDVRAARSAPVDVGRLVACCNRRLGGSHQGGST